MFINKFIKKTDLAVLPSERSYTRVTQQVFNITIKETVFKLKYILFFIKSFFRRLNFNTYIQVILPTPLSSLLVAFG